jgi:type IV pilus assembly protein PilW
MFNSATKPARRGASTRDSASAGFSLVEVMVAMVIGMLGIIVMMQMFSVFEGQKRTTTGGDDAISSGAVSLYGLERDIQQSGWGLSAVQLIGCTVTGLSVAGSADLPLVPVTINFPAVTNLAGQDVNTDTVLVISGNGNGALDGDTFTATAAASATTYAVHTPTSFTVNDRVVAAHRNLPCGVLTLSRVTAVTPLTVTPGSAETFPPDDLVFNLGQAPTARVYAIRGGNLTVCNYTAVNCAANNAGDWVPIANNVVSLRAQYGRDNAGGNMDGIVDVWDQTVPVPAAVAAGNPVNACAQLRVAAVRVALLARSSQPERTFDWPALTKHVTDPGVSGRQDPRLWAGNDGVATAIDAAAAGAVAISPPSPDPTWPTWQDFRYKTFQTVIPLRNVTSQGAVFGC